MNVRRKHLELIFNTEIGEHMIRMAICDDDYKAIEKIEQYLGILNDNLLEYEEFFCGEELQEYMLKENVEFDVYMLDIEMKNLSGIELAKKIRENDANALIVFITSHSQYVYDVFDVVTFDFIKKPLDFQRFRRTVDKIERYLCVANKNFDFNFRKNNYSIALKKISRLEKDRRRVWIYTTNGNNYHCNMKISDIWEQLDEDMFASLNQSLIVNIAEIEDIIGDKIVMKNGENLYVSRNYRRDLKKKHLNYMRGQL